MKTGMSIIGVVQTVFIILWAVDVLKWPWYFVFSPMMIYTAIIILLLAFVGAMHMALEKKREKKQAEHFRKWSDASKPKFQR